MVKRSHPKASLYENGNLNFTKIKWHKFSGHEAPLTSSQSCLEVSWSCSYLTPYAINLGDPSSRGGGVQAGISL